MELTACKIQTWQEAPPMCSGAPMPEVLARESYVCVAYIPSQATENVGGREAFAVVRFDGVLQYTFGYPNDEALQGHPLYAFGLEFYSFNEVLNSPTVAELALRNNALFPGSAPHYMKYKHWVSSFHDETLEVIGMAISYLGTASAMSGHEAILTVLNRTN